MELSENTGEPSQPNCKKIDEMFTVDDDVIPEIPKLKDHVSGTRKDGRSIGKHENAESKTNWESFINACDEFSNDSKKVIKYIKRKIRGRRGEKHTEVKAIHIVPDEDEDRWAQRPADSAASRSSTDTAHSSCSTGSKEDDGIEIVHDMEVENPEGC